VLYAPLGVEGFELTSKILMGVPAAHPLDCGLGRCVDLACRDMSECASFQFPLVPGVGALYSSDDTTHWHRLAGLNSAGHVYGRVGHY
jgi:hypothetical protein